MYGWMSERWFSFEEVTFNTVIIVHNKITLWYVSGKRFDSSSFSFFFWFNVLGIDNFFFLPSNRVWVCYCLCVHIAFYVFIDFFFLLFIYIFFCFLLRNYLCREIWAQANIHSRITKMIALSSYTFCEPSDVPTMLQRQHTKIIIIMFYYVCSRGINV